MFSKTIVASFFLLLIGIVLGVFVTPFLPNSLRNIGQKYHFGVSQTTIDKTSSNYQAGFNDAKKLVEESSLGSFFRTENDIRSVSGTITAVDGNRLTLHSNAVGNPFDSSSISDRTIVVDTNTKIVKLTEKDPATIKTEMDALVNAQKNSQGTEGQKPATILPYVETTVDASNILVGDSVAVTAEENVKTLSEFTAKEIRIQPKMFVK